MNPPAIPTTKLLIRSISLADAKEAAEEIINLSRIESIRSHVLERIPAVSLE
jgi:signal transduction protein with GAF and PtsI domain